MANDKFKLIYATMPNLAVGEEIGGRLVDGRLAACVNLIPGMVAIYRWQGERHRDSEVVLIAKTRADLAERAVAAIRAEHPYQTPAVVVVAIDGGSDAFLEWISQSTG